MTTSQFEKLKKYFHIKELVCKHVYEKHGDKSWQFFDPRMLAVLLDIRELIGKPMVVNNWAKGGNYSQRGLRCNICSLVKEKTSLEKVYIPAHAQGTGFDFHVPGMTSEEVRKKIERKQVLLSYPIRIERGTEGWVHIDVRTDGLQMITYFNG